jgi:hypothetical protein
VEDSVHTVSALGVVDQGLVVVMVQHQVVQERQDRETLVAAELDQEITVPVEAVVQAQLGQMEQHPMVVLVELDQHLL